MRLSLSQMSAKYLARDFWNIIRTKDETERQEIFCGDCIQGIRGKISSRIEEMHKKICISSLFFCSFALKCNLGIFVEGEKYGFFCES